MTRKRPLWQAPRKRRVANDEGAEMTSNPSDWDVVA
jgi:hypothetical protein